MNPDDMFPKKDLSKDVDVKNALSLATFLIKFVPVIYTGYESLHSIYESIMYAPPEMNQHWLNELFDWTRRNIDPDLPYHSDMWQYTVIHLFPFVKTNSKTFIEPILDKQIGEFMAWGMVYDYRAHYLNYVVDTNAKALLPDLRMLFVGYIQGDSLDTSHMISTANNILEYFINYMAEIQQRMYPNTKREIHIFASFELLKNWCERTQKMYMLRIIDNNLKK